MFGWAATRKSIKAYGQLAMANNMRQCMGVTVIYIALLLLLNMFSGTYSVFSSALMGTLVSDAARPLHVMVELLFRMRLTDWVVTLLVTVIIIMAEAPLLVGINAFFMKLVRRPMPDELPPKVTEIFGWYLNVKLNIKTVLLNVVTRLLSVAWNTLFLALPVTVLYFLENTVSYVSFEEADVSYLGKASLISLLMVAAICVAAVRLQAYMPATYLMAQQTELGVKEALSLSVKITRRHLIELFVFQLSFITWYIFMAFTMGIAFIYVFPYKEAATAAYIRKLHFDYSFPELSSNGGAEVSIQSKISRRAAEEKTEDENK